MPSTTSENGDDKRLARIRALLAKAEDPAATEAERETYNTKVAQLIAQYGIDEALLGAREPARETVGNRTITVDAPYTQDKAVLLYRVAERLRCRPLLMGTAQVKVYGMASDLDRVELLYTSLLVQASFGLATACPANPRENIKAYRRTWLRGFTSAVSMRLMKAERAAAERAEHASTTETDVATGSAPVAGRAIAGPSVALVLANRDALVQNAYEADHPKGSTTARRRSLSGTGSSAGYAAGQRADLGGSRLAGNSRRAVGR